MRITVAPTPTVSVVDLLACLTVGPFVGDVDFDMLGLKDNASSTCYFAV